MTALSALALQNVLRLRETLGTGIGGHPRTPSSYLSESHCLFLSQWKASPAIRDVSGSEVQGWLLTNGWVSQHHLSFGHLSLYPLTAELLLSHALGPLKCSFFRVVCLAWPMWRIDIPAATTVTFLQAPQKVSKEGPWLSYIPPLQLLPLAVLFPSNSACSMMPVCVMGIPSPQPPMSNLSFRSSIFSLLICHLGRDNTPMLLRRAKWGRGGTNCLPAKQEHKTGAAIAVREHIKAIISLPVHSQETKPLQSPAGNHPRQRHLHGTSPQGCRAEGMICLYSAIKALILSFLFPSCGSQ